MTQMLPRFLKIKLPKGQSAFLWGPRKTGKTTFLGTAFPESLRYDLLQTDVFLEFVKRPFLLREQLLAVCPKQLKEPVIIDEVQKVPQLLDEIHWLIENKGLRFILCGSSARKLSCSVTVIASVKAFSTSFENVNTGNSPLSST